MKLTPASHSSLVTKGKVKNKKLFTYGIFVCVAIIMWYINNLDKIYTTEIWVPVTYQQPPKGMFISEDPGNRLLVEVHASGFALLKSYLYAQWEPVVLSLNRYPLKRVHANQKDQLYFLSLYAAPDISNALGTDVTVERIRPDSLVFRFSTQKTVKVPLTAVLNLEYKKQYMPKGQPQLHPDSIYVSGPSALVDTLKTVYTKPWTQKNVSDTLSATLGLVPHPRLTYSSARTKGTIPVERFTETTVSVPISVINIPEKTTVRTFPAQITIQCKVGISDFERLTPTLFTAQMDYSSLQNNVGRNPKARVTLSMAPWWISDVTFSPSSVEYLIER